MIIAVVGSGGKTSLIRHLAHQFLREGKSVFVTTTTHMFIEEDTLLTDDAKTILHAMQKTGYAMAGIPDGPKIKALSKETFCSVSACADVVLVEADGSKHMPLKYPNATEPVIPDCTERIIVVWGPHGLGKPAGAVCHRLELVMKCLNITEDTIITEEHVRKLLVQGYQQPLAEKFPNAEISFYPPL